jgi:MoxR-like ATPase
VVTCKEFPIVILTSNGEREFPPAFLRRCLRLTLRAPGETELLRIVNAHFRELAADQRSAIGDVVTKFMARRKEGELSTDQLLNAVYLTLREIKLDRETLIATVWKYLNQIETLEDQ